MASEKGGTSFAVGGSTYTPSSRSTTGHVLTDAERRQRIAAAEASARKRRTAAAAAKASSKASSQTTTSTSGLGDPKAAGYVNTDRARSAFESNGVTGNDVTQRREPKSGFLVFAGKNAASHQAFVTSLKQMGFRTSIGADGSGVAVNDAGQAIKIGPSGNAPGAAPSATKKRRWVMHK